MAAAKAKGYSVYYRAASGLWCASALIPHPGTGTRRLTRSAKTRDLAECKLLEALSTYAPTVREFLQRWMDACQDNDRLSPITLSEYQRVVNGLLIPVIGCRRLHRVSSREVADLVRMHARQGQSVDVRETAVRVLKGAFQAAIEEGILAQNPCEGVSGTLPSEARVRTWDLERARRFIRHASGHRYWGFFYLALVAGLRPRELAALTWGDLDLAKACLRVHVARQEPTRGGKGLKACSGRDSSQTDSEHAAQDPRLADPRFRSITARTLWLPDAVVSKLTTPQGHYIGGGAQVSEASPMFPNKRGSFLSLPDLSTREFWAIVWAARVGDIGLGGLRETCRSLLVKSRHSKKFIDGLLGIDPWRVSNSPPKSISRSACRKALAQLDAMLTAD